MDVLRELGGLALGSRLKALSERLYDAVDRGYTQLGLGMQARWFPLLQCVAGRGPVTVTEAAVAIGQTHSAVSQLAGRLVEAGLLERRASADDGRCTHLLLSADGERLWARMGPAWLAVRRAVDGIAGTQLLAAIDACEQALATCDLDRRIVECHTSLTALEATIVPYRAVWAGAFRRLNERWLRRYFSVEPVDREVLADPQQRVLAAGGKILFAVIDGEPVGTCALLKEADGVYELAKMAVDPCWQGRGIGARLLAAAIELFRDLGGGTLLLESSSRLSQALRLYERAGFERQPGVRPGSHYARADVYMLYRGPGAYA